MFNDSIKIGIKRNKLWLTFTIILIDVHACAVWVKMNTYVHQYNITIDDMSLGNYYLLLNNNKIIIPIIVRPR